jgi:cell division protein FtsN
MEQMPSHEEGEFELVLGNKQLLSVFFLVILLLGVFFSMGYIVGRNTAPAGSLSAANRQQPIVVEPAGAPPTRPPITDPSRPSALTPKVEPGKAEPPATKVQPPPVEPAKPATVEPPKPAQTAKAEPPKVEPAKPKPEPPKPAPAAKGGGTFLQVVATRPADADRVVAALIQKGFQASTTPVPDSDLVRVVVGPLGDNEAVSRTRSGLEAAGFKPIIRRF